MLEKIGAAEINGLLKQASVTITNLVGENQQLRDELAERDRKDHAIKIANEAAERGQISVDNVGDYAEKLASSGRDLNMVEEFVTNAAPEVPLGSFTKEASEDSASGMTPEERFEYELMHS